MNELVEKTVKSLRPDEYDTTIEAFIDVVSYLEGIGENDLAERVWSQKELLKAIYKIYKER